MMMSEQIIQVIDALCIKLGIAVDWTNENVMPYMATLCEKLISYEIGTSIAWMVIWLILSIGCIVGIKKLISIHKSGMIDLDELIYLASVGLVFIILVTIGVVVSQTMDIIKCVTFPEMHIFEYIQGVINAA